MDLSEKETRERYIDPILKKEGWRDEYIKKENKINEICQNKFQRFR
ncbi:MAG: hypothetical protein QXF25_01295 [Candidatus Pacearchaeota archaeon]